MAAMDTVIS